MINEVLSKNMRSLGNIKTTCRIGKCIKYHNFRCSYQSAMPFIRPLLLIFPSLYAYFSSLDAKWCQAGNPDAGFKIPSKNPVH